MKIVRTTQAADAVATALRKALTRTSGPEGSLYPYFNGRERGWTVWFGTDCAWTFSEARGSDDIVVYERPDWGCFMDTLTDTEYDAKRFFSTPVTAAKWIARQIKAHLREVARKRTRRSA